MLQGCFSYFNSNTFIFQIDDNTQDRMTRLDNENSNYVPAPVPPNLTVSNSA